MHTFEAASRRPAARHHSVCPFLITALFVGALAACSVAERRDDPLAAIGRSISPETSIEFRIEGAPLDECVGPFATLSLADAVRLALRADSALQAGLARVIVARTEADEAQLAPDLVLDVVLRFAEGGLLQPEVGLDADLIALLRRPRVARIAEDRLRVETADVLAIALDVVFDVQSHYSAIQLLEARQLVIAERAAIVKRLRDISHARSDAGEGSRSDVQAFELEDALLQVDVAEIADEARRERIALARRIGTPSHAADWQLAARSADLPELQDEATWIEVALSREPGVQRAQWEVAAREEEQGLVGLSAFDGARIGVAAESEDAWSIGPAISSPLPWPERQRLRHERALAAVAESRHLAVLARRRAVEDVRTAYALLRSSRANVARLRDEVLPLLERRRTSIERAYIARDVDVTALLIADRALLESRERLLNLERSASSARYRLERAAGGPAAFARDAASSESEVTSSKD